MDQNIMLIVIVLVCCICICVSASIGFALFNNTTTTTTTTTAPTTVAPTTAVAQTTTVAPTTTTVAPTTTVVPTTAAPIKANCTGPNAKFNVVGNNGTSTSFPFTLNVCDSLVSPDGSHTLAVQSDGNIVLYNNNNKTSPWALSQIGVPATATSLTLQSDNNICADGTAPHWCSMSNGKGGNSIVIQNDGNFVQYADNGQPVWSTNTQGK